MEDEAIPPNSRADWLEEAWQLDRAKNALDMRRARLLAVIKRMDLAPLGYSSFGAFCAAEVEAGDTRISQLIRLAECPFAKVRAAVVQGRLAPSVAIRGLPVLDAEGEDAWLADALDGAFSRPRRRERELEVEFGPEDTQAVDAARTLARLNLGRFVSDAEADRQILGAWRAQEPRSELVRKARTPPPPPTPLPPWTGPDAADPFVGPWVDPEDAGHARALLGLVTAMQRDRIRQLGQALEFIDQGRMYEDAGFRSFKSWAHATLSVDVRTLQRYRKALEAHPDLDLSRALFLEEVATEDTREEWGTIVPLVPAAEFERVRVMARRGSEKVLREAYTRAIAELDTLLGPTHGPTDGPTNGVLGFGPTDGPTNGAKRRYVSLAATLPPPRAPRAAVGHPDLPVAARWYLEQAKPPRQGGLGWVHERDAFTCTNPECARRTLRVHVHHWNPRKDGGTDESENVGDLCPGCHLRLRHSGHLATERRGNWLIFNFTDRVIAMAGYFPR